MQVGDWYILHSENGMDYKIKIININYCRPPEMLYAVDVYDENGNHPGDVTFLGDEFFKRNINKLDKMK